MERSRRVPTLIEKMSNLVNWQRTRVRNSSAHIDEAIKRGVRGLVVRERDQKEITLTDGRSLVEFMSCSYLGLECDPRLAAALSEGASRWGVQLAAARTRMRTENFDELEALLKEIFCGMEVILFPNVHSAHLGLLPLLASGELPSFPMAMNGPVFLLEKTAHASIQINRGNLLQFGAVKRVSLEDPEALQDSFAECQRSSTTPILLTDSVGSMGGLADIAALARIAEAHDGYLYLDDAHGTSLYGKRGEGYALRELGSAIPRRSLIVSSLAKGFGCPGGAVICMPTVQDAEYMRKHGATFIFGGPPALPMIDVAIASSRIHLSDELPKLQSQLWQNTAHFDRQFGPHALNSSLESPVRGLMFETEGDGLATASHFMARGFATTLASYPVVANGRSLIRLAISANHLPTQIERLAHAFAEVAELNPQSVATEAMYRVRR